MKVVEGVSHRDPLAAYVEAEGAGLDRLRAAVVARLPIELKLAPSRCAHSTHTESGVRQPAADKSGHSREGEATLVLRVRSLRTSGGPWARGQFTRVDATHRAVRRVAAPRGRLACGKGGVSAAPGSVLVPRSQGEQPRSRRW